MRKKGLRMLAAAGCVCLAALTFTACGKKPEETTAAETSAAETAEGGEAAEAAPVKPESYGTVTLGEYKNLYLEVRSTDISDERVDDYIDNLVNGSPVYEEVDRPAENGDTVNINYRGLKDGVPFDGGTADGYDLTLGTNTFIDGFEEGLVGAKKGDELSLDLTFPAEYHSAELAGQAVVFEVTVNAVKVAKTAEFNDEWVASYTGGAQKSADEFREQVRKTLADQSKRQEMQEEWTEVAQAAMDNSTFELNPDAVAYEAYQQKNSMLMNLAMMGYDLNNYLSLVGKTEEEFNEDMNTLGEQSAKMELLVDKIFEQEQMKLTDADYKQLEKEYGMARGMMEESYGKEMVEREARYMKVLNFLVDNADKVKVVDDAAAVEIPAETAAEGEAAAEAGTEAAEEPAAEAAEEPAAEAAEGESAAQ